MAIVCRASLSAQLWAAITKCRRLGGLNKINLFSHSSGSHKSAIREPAWSGSGEVSSWFACGRYLAVDSHAAWEPWSHFFF